MDASECRSSSTRFVVFGVAITSTSFPASRLAVCVVVVYIVACVAAVCVVVVAAGMLVVRVGGVKSMVVGRFGYLIWNIVVMVQAVSSRT